MRLPRKKGGTKPRVLKLICLKKLRASYQILVKKQVTVAELMREMSIEEMINEKRLETALNI